MKRNPPRPTPGDDPLVGRRRSGLCRRGRRARPLVDAVVDCVRRLSQARLQLAGSTQAIGSKAFCLWMEPARLPSRREATLLRSLNFGFSWRVAVSLRKLPLMRVGFPWISLDSLARIEAFQSVTRKERRKIFPRAFSPCVSRAGTKACGPCGSAGLFMGRA